MGRYNRNRSNKVNMGDRGFSLIEVVLAMVILAIISLPLLRYFTESIRYSAMMARRQRATLLAQEVTEAMKAEEQLIQYDTGIFQAPLLTGTDPGCYNLTMSGSGPTFDEFKNSGLGTAVFAGTYSGTNGDFDLQVTLNTDIPSNEPGSTAAYGIHNNTDALAVESDQLGAAIMYFRSTHSDYCNNHPGTPLLSQDEIEARLSRKIYIDVDRDPVELKFSVQAHYEYNCTGVAGVDAADTFTSTKLVDVRLDTLKNIYLLYSCMSNGASDNITLNISSDALSEMTLFKEEAGDPDSMQVKMGLYLVAQDIPSGGTPYTVTVDGVGVAVPSTYMVSVHSNIDTPNQVINNVGSVKKPLTSTLTSIRLVSITTEVFPSGHADGDEALATMTTTKGEQP